MNGSLDVRDAREIPLEKFCRTAINNNKRRDIDNNSFYNLALAERLRGSQGDGKRRLPAFSGEHIRLRLYMQRVILLSS